MSVTGEFNSAFFFLRPCYLRTDENKDLSRAQSLNRPITKAFKQREKKY